jgi:N-methylhydantoinase B
LTRSVAGLESVDDPLTIEIMRRYLVSTVEEMVRTTTRTAYSTCFSEALDFTCALFNEKGKMTAQAAGVPVHVGSLGVVLNDIFKHYDTFKPGDVVIHNDPYAGGSHQADVVAARPMFFGDELIGFAVNRGHWVDIGGMAAGGWGGSATHVVQEALIIPPSKLYREGQLVREIRDFVLRNVRIPKYAWGDLQSQIASAITAERRIGALCERYGVAAVREAGELAISYSRDRFHKQMEIIPDGEYRAEDFMENDGRVADQPRKIALKLTKQGTRLVADFSGSDPQVGGPINATLSDTMAGTYTGLINIIDPEIPINSGVLDAVEIIAPLGSIVNPVYPAPVFAGIADTADRIYEIVFLALADVVPHRITAGSYASGNCTTGAGMRSDGSEFVWYSFGGGGCGARSFGDGNTGEWHAMATCRNEPAEIWENRYPLRVIDFRVRPDSAGAGRWRGGLGHVKALELLEDTYLSACADRNVIPPFGLAGGKPGACNRLTIEIDREELTFTDAYRTISPSKFSNLLAPKGSVYRIYAGGGGGFGSPRKRPVELVQADVEAGYVTVEAAREEYFVVIDPTTLKVDNAATEKLRSAR